MLILCVHACLRICLVGITLGGWEIEEKMTKFSYKIDCNLKLQPYSIFVYWKWSLRVSPLDYIFLLYILCTYKISKKLKINSYVINQLFKLCIKYKLIFILTLSFTSSFFVLFHCFLFWVFYFCSSVLVFFLLIFWFLYFYFLLMKCLSKHNFLIKIFYYFF